MRLLLLVSDVKWPQNELIFGQKLVYGIAKNWFVSERFCPFKTTHKTDHAHYKKLNQLVHRFKVSREC